MSNITLHEATEQVRALLDQLDPISGELPPEFEQARAVVAAKATAVTAYILESERQAEYLKDYAQSVIERAHAIQRRTEWLRDYLKSHMAAAGISSVKDDRGLFSASLQVGRDKAVDIFDTGQLPPDYWREIPARLEPDKPLIRKAIDDGHEVPGARIVARDRLVVK